MNDNVLYLQAGKNIISPNDPLKKISIADFYKLVSEPDAELVSKIQQLRIVQSIDPKKYHALKKMLPYITCGIFNPPYRRTENFAAIKFFILDFDHLISKNIDPVTLRNKLTADQRIHLMFISPGNDGLKLVFCLHEKCFDHAKYSMFYKLFASNFSKEYGLEQSVDKVTSDVTRACFLSVDEQAWFNPDAVSVNMNALIDFDSFASLEKATALINAAKAEKPEMLPEDGKEEKQQLPADLLLEIKQKLNPNIKTKIEKQIFVPDELIAVVNKVEEKMTSYGISTKSIESIHYGKKFVFVLNNHWAQLNLFFGKQGFKIVKTPASGSNSELAEVTYRILCEMFY